MVLCNCGQDAIIVTSWTDLNPGRRFCSCPTMNPNCGRFHRVGGPTNVQSCSGNYSRASKTQKPS
ncbi:putative transcription factor GRF family [Helianthus annuus]|uniref:Putative zinc finger, GRF-type n=1 Tax=Helianthus annuus TaxID=4232 RepID=A0A251T7G5_HELAN|nr:putative transcription factor GRF family [Helianthus annuus]KAJ0526454.1 putative transcription factor GRF family [Helianthus annuus]KAJ0542846.1 putative transcription factor GRF family [Helianthus annuus]KAJ0711877.1 putative transcription factor GRF family [Helianthus annuus]KAJ0807679.1 putative transcription factor GRF family [Helianthus annuus]